MKRILLGLLFGLSSVGASAESFALKDGSKVVGKVVQSDASTVTVESSSLGTLNLRRDEILTSPTPKVAKTALTLWSGNVSGGLQLNQSSKKTEDFNFGASARREDESTDLSLSTNYRFTSDKDRKGKRTITNNSTELEGRYEWKLPPNSFAYVSADFEHDGVNDVNLRTVAGVGAGKKLVNTKDLQVKMDLGVANVSYDFSDNTRSSHFAALTFGGQLKARIASGTNLTAGIAYHPSLDDNAKFHLSGSLGVQTAITSSWFFNLQFLRKYDSITSIAGRKDTSKWTLGIGYRF